MPSPPTNQPTTSEAGDARVYFAAQRTLLAWIRTGIALMAFGFVVARFGLFLRELEKVRGTPVPNSGNVSAWTGTAIICVGVTLLLVAGLRFARFASEFKKGLPPRLPSIGVEISLALLMAAIGIGLAVYLAAAR